jgi:hypothetical protein
MFETIEEFAIWFNAKYPATTPIISLDDIFDYMAYCSAEFLKSLDLPIKARGKVCNDKRLC